MRFLVKHDYGSNTFGPWNEGDFIELDPVEAGWVNHDSPGTLEEVDPDKQARDKRDRQQAEERTRQAERDAKSSGGTTEPRKGTARKTTGK